MSFKARQDRRQSIEAGVNVTSQLRRISMIWAVTAILLLQGLSSARTSRKSAEITDPIFGLLFNPATVKYEPMAQKIRTRCAAFGSGNYWTFAYLRQRETEYFIVVGTSATQDGDMFGTAISINDSGCQEEESAWALSGFVPRNGYPAISSAKAMLPGDKAKEVCDNPPFGECHYMLRSATEEAILRGLIQDALARAQSAWKGVGGIRKQVCNPGYLQMRSSTPVLRNEVERFCKE